MAHWQTETTEILRVLIDDMDDPPKYEDEKLERILLVSAFIVNDMADFNADYIVDIETSTLNPDPTSVENRDDSFVNLMCLKAACVMERAATSKASGRAIAGREGFSSLDLKGIADAKQKILQKGGFCPTFDEQLLMFLSNASSIAGVAVLGPFRTYANAVMETPYSIY